MELNKLKFLHDGRSQSEAFVLDGKLVLIESFYHGAASKVVQAALDEGKTSARMSGDWGYTDYSWEATPIPAENVSMLRLIFDGKPLTDLLLVDGRLMGINKMAKARYQDVEAAIAEGRDAVGVQTVDLSKPWGAGRIGSMPLTWTISPLPRDVQAVQCEDDAAVGGP